MIVGALWVLPLCMNLCLERNAVAIGCTFAEWGLQVMQSPVLQGCRRDRENFDFLFYVSLGSLLKVESGILCSNCLNLVVIGHHLLSQASLPTSAKRM